VLLAQSRSGATSGKTEPVLHRTRLGEAMSEGERRGREERDSADTLVDVRGAHSDVRALAKPRRGKPEDRIGERIAERYELVRLLGAGSSGAVYEAADTQKNEPVAIKLLHEHLRTSDGHVKRFAREVRATSTIAHSAVVRVLDAGEDRGGTLFLVMELLQGQLLFQRMSKTPLETREVVEIGRQLLGALAAAHARGVVHRDIKPENLFLTESDSGAIRLKVLDFGIAKLLRPQATISFQTLDGLILGTPAYMSPELCRGMPVTDAADLWAAASVLYELFSGDPPFDEEHVGRLILKIVKERAPSLATHRPDLPAPVIEAVDRALDPDPAKRWQNAAEFGAALSSGMVSIADLDWDDL
jgi:serine/threonine protein kinase